MLAVSRVLFLRNMMHVQDMLAITERQAADQKALVRELEVANGSTANDEGIQKQALDMQQQNAQLSEEVCLERSYSCHGAAW